MHATEDKICFYVPFTDAITNVLGYIYNNKDNRICSTCLN